MEKLDRELVAGGFETSGVIDLGVVDVELGRSSMTSPGSKKRVDEDVEVLSEVITPFD